MTHFASHGYIRAADDTLSVEPACQPGGVAKVFEPAFYIAISGASVSFGRFPMNFMWGNPPWRREHKMETPALVSSNPDVAVVGGGLTGVSAAYHLARRGLRATVVEACRIGDGASGRTGGIALEGTARGVKEGADTCLATLERVVRDERIECGLKLEGCWEIQHQGPGTPLPWDDGGKQIHIAKTVPGGIVDPMAMLYGIARAAIREGAVIHENARVRRVVEKPARLELDGAVIEPGFVVIAANAWISSLVPAARAVGSALTFACATEPLDSSTLDELGLGAGIPFYTIDLPYLWGRETSDHRVIFGAGLSFGSPAELEAMDTNSAEPSAVLDALEARVRRLNPVLRDVRFSARWAGPIAIPEDFTPILGRLPEAPNVLVAGGYSGHGVALSVHAGALIARAIIDGTPLPAWGSVL